jgi:hypothetical protein
MIRAAMLCLGGSLLVAASSSAQEPGHQGDTARGMSRQMMMQRVQAADARLDRLVNEMNRATGARKIPAMAAVINELVAQRKQMHQRMGQMMESGMMEGAGGGRQRMMPDMRPSGPDTGPARPSPADTGDHAQHHDSAGKRQ